MPRILAYTDRISARPGESIKVMVSCDGLDSYNANLVRIIQGDTNPDGPGYREEPIDLNLGGPFAGRFQPIHAGSYGLVENTQVLSQLSSFQLQATVWPTLPGHGAQTILCREDPKSGSGFRLSIDKEGAATFVISTPGTAEFKISTGLPLLKERWYQLSASYDAQTGRISVQQQALKTQPHVSDHGSASGLALKNLTQADTNAALMIAARSSLESPACEYFNGRIEAPRIYAEVSAEIHKTSPVAAWDFSQGISTDQITDTSANQLHGRLINLPTRGVPGQTWNGDEHCWQKRPDHYAAIHFHDDDLYDCAWNTDFEITIPDDLPSAVYAVRLHSDQEAYYVPFAVRPAQGTTTAPVAFLLPTASYMAYANNRIGIDVPETEIVCGRLLQMNPVDLFMQEHPEIGLCFYDLHNDGSGVYYSSRLRPVVNMQPGHIGHLGGTGSNVWQFNADTHILDWLEQTNQPFDVITDEDLEAEGVASIAGYQAVMTGTHPEYYSLGMLDAVQNYVDQGGKLMYMGGNGFYWRVSYHPTLPGVIECRKSEDGIRAFAPRPGEFYASFTGEYTGLWRRNGRAPNELVGIGMVSQGFDISSPYIRTQASRDSRVAFIFEGVEGDVIGDYGLCGGGAAGLELDAADHALGTPPGTIILASSERHTDLYLMTPEDMNDPAPGLGGSEAEIIRADMVYFETNNKGAVFSTGSIAWAGSLSHEAYNNDIARITSNVLKRFLEDT